ncbi:MAG: hypothetical protein GX946_08925 [Oligosphaeraceae bacterium]|nr:hypothetical protein [Oligosphaeraceae bacterium]
MAAFFFSFLLCLFGAPVLFAQPAAAAVDMTKLDETFKQEVEAHQLYTRRYETILLGLGSLRQVPGDEEKLRQALKLGKNLRDLNNNIQAAQRQQLGLINRINQLSDSKELLPQQESYVNHYLQKLRELGNEQNTIMNTLRRKSRELQKFILDVPPPKSFVNKLGIKMILQGQTTHAFYVSEQPVKQAEFAAMVAFKKNDQKPDEPLPQSAHMGNVNLEQAEEFCRTLSRYEGFTYRMPEQRELSMLQTRQYLPEIAVWSRSKWTPNWREEEAQKRFACFLYTIWDPSKLLGDNYAEDALAGELKNANYAQLGFIVITAARTGKQLRMQRLQAELLED